MPPTAPALAVCSDEAAALINLSPEICKTSDFVDIFSGRRLLPGMEPFAMCYGGHQFGSWAGQLGDGRAINLGEVLNLEGERWILQLKGAGLTPYSRFADGLAVLRSSVREFLCSEAMFHLGVPTTRALSVVTTGQKVVRDMFYDGHPREEPGAVVCRLAPSFTRFGNFEIFAARQEYDVLRRLAEYTLLTDYPDLGPWSDTAVLRLFEEVCRRTANMTAHWMAVGFVHGVMNTDNMSILGLTIDYGPYGWLENYDPDWTPNTTDASGRRYCFGRQPQIAHWNLAMLANALCPLVPSCVDGMQEILDGFPDFYRGSWQDRLRAKLGLSHFETGQDEGLTDDLFKLLAEVETDMTLFFRTLAEADLSEVFAADSPKETAVFFREAYYKPEKLTADYCGRLREWFRRYERRIRSDEGEFRKRSAIMLKANPKYVLRNYLVQTAIEKAEDGDFSEIRELLDLIRRPYESQPGRERFAARRPEWARSKPGCSMLSCSS